MRALVPRLALLAGLSLLVLVAAPSCSSQTGTTPKCTMDVDENGNKHLADGCNPFPKCDKGPASECCKGLVGSDYANCLYGYGEGSITTTTSSGGGAGGKGTGGNGTGGTGGSGGSGGAGGN